MGHLYFTFNQNVFSIFPTRLFSSPSSSSLFMSHLVFSLERRRKKSTKATTTAIKIWLFLLLLLPLFYTIENVISLSSSLIWDFNESNAVYRISEEWNFFIVVVIVIVAMYAIFPFFLSCFQCIFSQWVFNRDQLINLSIWCTRFYFALLSIKHTRSVCESGGWWVAWLAAQMKMDTKQMDLNQKLMEIHLCDMVFDMWFCCPSFYRLRKQTQARARTFANDFIAKSIAERGHTCTG